MGGKIVRQMATVAIAALVAVGAGTINAGTVSAQPRVSPTCGVSASNAAATVNDLRFSCSQAEYDALYRSLSPGPVPVNAVAQGFVRDNPVAELVWHGKTFGSGTVSNRVLGAEVFPASVYVGTSFMDGRPTIVIDYAGGPLGFVRDEIRQVQPGVYAGFAYDRSGAPRVIERFILVF
ncbi:hypothetical protein IEU95_07220 [Hoyosella rhizosphaerae]|uniref:3D domain-containing protein n=1 Tax=Hoyosella rhizosphaerae TaxID=1755582 RepID=A0A916XB59_9ACTN|nr:hypothetical protein [Hoyosella rhizosphaerae]MBN4926613.1 hypothetical protein [Hoyosella rhizosphaerae]GGC57914.1 hypothetical protein GCM10011410_07950 [Hoyosella rhizosphaerae]